MPLGALIFDFDGVIADSEALANQVLADFLTGLGSPTTMQQSLDRYMGKRWDDAMALIQATLPGPLPMTFSEDLKLATLARFRTDLREVRGASHFIHTFTHLPQCIASSSAPDRLELCLSLLGLRDHFGSHVFSAEMVERGKPHPDLFLLAAERLKTPAAACLVIEDSPSGVRGGVSAGMRVLGLSAGAHCGDGHQERLKAAGARSVASTWSQAERLVRRWARSL